MGNTEKIASWKEMFQMRATDELPDQFTDSKNTLLTLLVKKPKYLCFPIPGLLVRGEIGEICLGKPRQNTSVTQHVTGADKLTLQ